jgi:uncharacterized Zn-binding protein involved in type VI secretion
MAAVTRLGDPSAGHCFSLRGNSGASGDVFANGIAVHRQGDPWPTHTCGTSSHASATSGGSGTVFINGKPCARIGDALDCGDAIAVGSGNVFAGG